MFNLFIKNYHRLYLITSRSIIMFF